MSWIKGFFETKDIPNTIPKHYPRWHTIPLLFRFPLVIPVLLDMLSHLIVEYIWKSRTNILYIIGASGFLYWSQGHLLHVLQVLFVDTVPPLLSALRQLLVTEQLVAILVIWLGTWIFFPSSTTGLIYLLCCFHQCVGACAAILFMYKLCGYYITFGCIALTIYGYFSMPTSRQNKETYMSNVAELSKSIIASPVMAPIRRTIYRTNSGNSFAFSGSDTDDEVFTASNLGQATPVNSNRSRRRPRSSSDPAQDSSQLFTLPQPRLATAARNSANSNGSTGSNPGQITSATTTDESISIMFVFILLGMVLVWENAELRLIIVTGVSVAIIWSLTKALFKAIFVYFEDSMNNVRQTISKFFKKRKKSSVVMVGLWKSFSAGNASISTILETVSSQLASFFTITLSLLLLGAFMIFMTIQIYYEAQQCVLLFPQLFAQLVSKVPAVEKYMKDLDMDAMIEAGFHRFQDFVRNYVETLMAGSDNETIKQTQEQIRTMFERFYNLIIAPGKDKQHEETSQKFWDAIMSLDWMYALRMASDNINTIQEYLIIFMKVLLYNLTLTLSTLSDYTYVAFIFFVALFNSLSSSTKGYRPVEALMSYLPTSERRFQVLISKIQKSVVQVFYATFRLAIFYTVWTCIAHKMIGTTLVNYFHISSFTKRIYFRFFYRLLLGDYSPSHHYYLHI